MKKLLISIIAIIGILFAANAQKVDASKVPDAIKTSFADKYPGTTPEWYKEEEKYKANFKYMGTKMCALYDANGTLTETETEIKTDELPASVTAYIKDNYKDGRIKKAVKITKANGEVNYGAEVDDKKLIFDASGNFVLEKKRGS